MSSSLPAEDLKDAATNNAVASATLPVQDSASKDTVPAAERTDDETAPSSRPSTAKLIPDATHLALKVIDDGDHDDVEDDEIPYPDLIEEDSLLPPPDFKPFFTLIEDPTTGEHHHPTVHYLFADDDQEILTAAALEAVSIEQQQQQGHEDERFVIVDTNADGREVVAISSLSPDWQTLKTKVSQAPSWGDESKAGDRGLMLRISGQDAEVRSDEKQKGDVDELLKAFDHLAGTLDEVLSSTITDDGAQIAQ